MRSSGSSCVARASSRLGLAAVLVLQGERAAPDGVAAHGLRRPSAGPACRSRCGSRPRLRSAVIRAAGVLTDGRTPRARVQATVSGEYVAGGGSRLDGASIVGTGLVFAGPFRLTPGLAGLDRELRRLAVSGLGGTWRSRLDWRVSPGAGTGSASGIALATFANPQVGEACLRFEQTFAAVERGEKTARVVTRGTFTLLGGTQAAAALLGRGSFDVTVRPDGTMAYKGTTTAAMGPVPGLSAACSELEELP